MTDIKTRLNKDGAFPINSKLAGLVPMATEAEQAVLTADIGHMNRESLSLCGEAK